MPKVAEFIGTRLTGATLITGSGILRKVVISTLQIGGATVTLYDNTSAAGTVIAVFYVSRDGGPLILSLGRDDAFRFDTGLSATYANAEVNVWAVQLT